MMMRITFGYVHHMLTINSIKYYHPPERTGEETEWLLSMTRSMTHNKWMPVKLTPSSMLSGKYQPFSSHVPSLQYTDQLMCPTNCSQMNFQSGQLIPLSWIQTSSYPVTLTSMLTNPNDGDGCNFINAMTALGLTQHIQFPTHRSGKYLHLIFIEDNGNIVIKKCYPSTPLSNHCMVECNTSITPRHIRKTITVRPLGDLDYELLAYKEYSPNMTQISLSVSSRSP